MADEAASQALSQRLEQLKSLAWEARVEAVPLQGQSLYQLRYRVCPLRTLTHELRAFAAEALGYPLHATNAINALEQALSDLSADVREAAADSLLRLRASKTQFST